MAFRVRKLLNETESEPDLVKFCEKFCDDSKSPDGICPLPCINVCPDDCHREPFEFPPPPPPPPPPIVVIHSSGKPYKISLVLTVSLAVLAAAFFLFTCYTIYKFYSNWRNSRRRRRPSQPGEEEAGPDDFLDEDHGPLVDHPIWYIRTVGLQPSVISAITIVKYKKAEGLVEGTDCSVCLNEFEEDETLRLLPKCNHAFHIPCIDTWLRSHTNCPMCRAGIVINAAILPSQEVTAHNSGRVEEARIGPSYSSNSETENEASELRIGIDSESRALGLEEDNNRDKGGLDGIQPLRRSVSVDSLSASMISAAIANGNLDNQLFEVIDKRVGVNQSPLIERCSQTGSSSIKRSLSCSAKVFLSRHSSRNPNSDSVNPQ